MTTVLDAENYSLLLMVEGRSAEDLADFDKELREQDGDISQLEVIDMDMR